MWHRRRPPSPRTRRAAVSRPDTAAVERWVPGRARRFARTERPWLRADLVAGVVLAAILVPQGMAYAELAGLPPVTGLYTTIACLVGYALFGPSRVLVLGPDSSVSPLIFAAIIPLLGRRRPGDRDRAGRDAGAARRAHRDRARARQARLRRRPALERGAGRLHERPRHHDHRRPAAEAVRLLDRRRRLRRRGRSSSSAPRRRRTRRRCVVGVARARRPARAAPAVEHVSRAILVAVVGATVVSAVLGLCGRRGRDRRHAAAGRSRRRRCPWTDAQRRRRRCSSRRSGSRWSRSPTPSRRRRASRRGAATRSTPTRR